jgi:hypothetical protein
MRWRLGLAGLMGAALLSGCTSRDAEVAACGVASSGDGTAWRGVEARLVLPSPSVASGSLTTATLVVHNKRDRAVDINTVGPLQAVLVRPGTREIVGGWFGAVGGYGQELRIDAGASAEVSVGIQALGCIPHSRADADPRQFPLRPGTYGVLSWLPIGGRDDSPNRIPAPDLLIAVVPSSGRA